jgi:hypothetical protein
VLRFALGRVRQVQTSVELAAALMQTVHVIAFAREELLWSTAVPACVDLLSRTLAPHVLTLVRSLYHSFSRCCSVLFPSLTRLLQAIEFLERIVRQHGDTGTPLLTPSHPHCC